MEILGRIGGSDQRVLELVCAVLPEDPMIASVALADLDAHAAVPVVSRLLDELPYDPEAGLFAGQDLIEVADAIEELGGALTARQERRLADLWRRRRATLGPLPALLGAQQEPGDSQGYADGFDLPYVKPKRPGRNEPCWCGSGRKYRKCCLREDKA